MEKQVKAYYKYAKTLDYQTLVQEGTLCCLSLVQDVLDLSSGEIRSQDEFTNRVCTFVVSVLMVCKADGTLSDREVNYISQTTALPVTEVRSMASDVSLTSEDGTAVGFAIAENIKTKQEFDSLIKYCTFVSAVDGSFSIGEKILIEAYTNLGKKLRF